ncbi:MAG: histidine phosphatase family protein [Paenibacillaceae bacterium]|nr:histidine phosphatase family protein [Paenibacillaceae bacterium]
MKLETGGDAGDGSYKEELYEVARTQLALIRHGETDWNREKRNQGQRDIPLNAEGLRQAQLLAARLAGESWNAVYSSDLGRAAATARAIAEALGMEIDGYDERLREQSFGRLEGTTEAERIALWGERWSDLEHGVETEASVQERAFAAVRHFAGRHPGERIIMVSHGAWIGYLIDRLFPQMEREKMKNTSVTMLELEGDSWACSLFNCARHLDTFGDPVAAK